ncbi:MAG: Asp-tRNA(Asn)/Glu-tRNA(Gln) amidotransferase subunit GatB [Bacteroidota bacterium]|nr:Asp-tRNA(Asn)/Glu-tRNA(Gln) amidotransferase subunit GatB [Bacteroidota bacterium]
MALSQEITDKYETVVGLEVHAQLLTRTKAFSADPYQYGSAPNTQLSPINLAHPGTLPKPNLAGLKMAVKMGLACESEIVLRTHYSRKNYFYADLPKGYQITQFTTPICVGGQVIVTDAENKEKRISLDKIILEEDSGKSIHDLDPFATLIDLNRAGVPLIEIVSNPDIRTPEEAGQYLTEIRRMVRYLDICDGNMEEGSLRCDANVSIRPRGETRLYNRVEIKNLNSIRNVMRAIAFEVQRHVAIVEEGGKVSNDTRGFDPVKGETFAMRTKELANDYRYFPEPDIPPIVLTRESVEQIKVEMPELPKALRERLRKDYALSDYDAAVITADKETADYYLGLIGETGNYKAASNWLTGPIRSYLNENAKELSDLNITPQHIARLIQLIDENKISFSAASQKVFPELIKNGTDKDVDDIVASLNLTQVSDDDFLLKNIREVIDKYPAKAEEFKNGKKGLLGLFMGEVMKKTGGKADPKRTTLLLEQELLK